MRDADHYLRQAIDLDPDLYDAYLGLGIYDYFTDTLPGVQGVFFPEEMSGSRSGLGITRNGLVQFSD